MTFRTGRVWRRPGFIATVVSAAIALCSLTLVTDDSVRASGLIAGLIAVQAVWLQAVKPPNGGSGLWVRRLAWGSAALALAITGLRVGEIAAGGIADGKAAFLGQAILVQILFGAMVAITVGRGNPLRVRYGLSAHGPLPLFAVVAAGAQGALGAAVRYRAVDVIPHMAGAVVATIVIMLAAGQALVHHMQQPPIRRAALLLLSLTFSQVLLGLMAYMSRLVAFAQQPISLVAWFPALHAWTGSLVFGAAIRMALLVFRQLHPEDAELAHGGVAIA